MGETIQTTPPPDPAVELQELGGRLERMRADRDRVSRENATIREKYHALRDAFERLEAGGLERKCQSCGWSLDEKLESVAESVPEECPYPSYMPGSTPLRPPPDADMVNMATIFDPTDATILDGEAPPPGSDEQTIRPPLTVERIRGYAEQLAARGLGSDEMPRFRARSATALMLQQQQYEENLRQSFLRPELRTYTHITLADSARDVINYHTDGMTISHARGCVCDDCESFRESRGELRLNPTQMRVFRDRRRPNPFADAMARHIRERMRALDAIAPEPQPCEECFGISLHHSTCSRATG